MARVSGYKVTITGFLPVEKGSLDSAIETAQAIKTAKAGGSAAALLKKMKGVEITEKMGSADLDGEDANTDPDTDGEGEGDQSGEDTGDTSGEDDTATRTRRTRRS